MNRKRKCPELHDQPDCGVVPDIRKKLCVEEGTTVISTESERKDKFKSKIKNYNLVSSSSASSGGGEHGARVDVHHADHGGGREAAQTARARISALQISFARPGSAADGE